MGLEAEGLREGRISLGKAELYRCSVYRCAWERKTAFLPRFLKPELENASCLSQMRERFVSIGVKLKVCLNASWLGFQPG